MWLARVITLVLVLRHSVEEFSMCMVILPIYFISYKPFSTIARMIAIFFFFFSRLIRTNDKRCDYQSSPRSFISFLTAQAWRNDRFSRAPSQAQFWLVLKTMEMSGSKTPSVSSEPLVCSNWGMRNSTGSPIFSDFKSDLLSVARFSSAGQGERRLWVRGWQSWRRGHHYKHVQRASRY